MNKNTARAAVLRMCPPNAETVTLRVRSADETDGAAFTDYTVYRVSRRMGSDTLDQGDPVITQSGGVRFTFLQPMLDAASAPDPKISDMITDAGGLNWVIQSVDNSLFDLVIHVRCLRAGGG